MTRPLAATDGSTVKEEKERPSVELAQGSLKPGITLGRSLITHQRALHRNGKGKRMKNAYKIKRRLAENEVI